MIWSLSRQKETTIFQEKIFAFDLLDVTFVKISTVLSADFHRNRQLLNTPQGNLIFESIVTYALG